MRRLTFRTIPDLFVEAAERDGARPWLRTDEGSLTFIAALDRVCTTIDALSAAGIGRGDLVLATTRTTPPYLLLWLALTSMGVIAVTANPASAAAELRGLLAQTTPKA